MSLNHALVKLAKVVAWDRLEELFGDTYCSDNGHPGASARLMVALHYLKYSHNLSDEEVIKGWVENPSYAEEESIFLGILFLMNFQID